MKRLSILALSLLSIVSVSYLTTSAAQADSKNDLYLVGEFSGVDTDGAFPAQVTIKDPVSEKVLFVGKTLVDVKQGKYKAKLADTHLASNQTYDISLEGLEAAEDFTMAGFVNLQDTTPGTAQTGHLNISGYVLAGRIGLGTSPTLARVQVNETGTIQGVRSITKSGTAVYGQATAGTGLAAGGYFTTSSVGGRAMVGDALSTTGSTVGGLFYNRSTDGVAVWGRHVNNAGNSIGVFGQTSSTNGTAIVAENIGNANTARLGGPDYTILTTGVLPQHQYSASTKATSVPVAYGEVAGASGSILQGTSNWIITRVAAGEYDIAIDGFGSNPLVVVSAYGGNVETAKWQYGTTPNDIKVLIYNSTGTLTDSDFSFIAFDPIAFNTNAFRYAMPHIVNSKYGGDREKWAKDEPAAFQSWLKQVQAANAEAQRANLAPLPVDQAEPTSQSIRPRK